jgi:transketolase
VILLASGSELALCVEAFEKLRAEGVKARLVSMPSWELFEAQDAPYRERVLPPAVRARVAVEAGIKQGWERYLGGSGLFLGMSGYGASAPSSALLKHFGFTVERVLELAHEALRSAPRAG